MKLIASTGTREPAAVRTGLSYARWRSFVPFVSGQARPGLRHHSLYNIPSWDSAP